MLDLIASLLISLFLVQAQSFSPSPSWKNTAINKTHDEQISISGEALSQLVANYNPNVGNFNDDPSRTNFIPGVFFYEMARFDQLTSQNKYEDNFNVYFGIIQQNNPTFRFPMYNLPINYDLTMTNPSLQFRLQATLIYGYSSVYAYRAYQNDSYLKYAEDSWLSGSQYTLSQAQPEIPKNSGYQNQCNGLTMTGGTFNNNSTNDLYISAASTGAFFVLSSLLAEATSNETYLDAAKQSANFIHNHLTNANGLIMDGISADNCSQTAQLSPSNSGIMIEGLAILMSIAHDTSMQQWMEDIISKSVLQSPWNDPHGIVDENSHLNTITGLVAAFERANGSQPDPRNLISEYLAVQYNAVLSNAAINGSDLYGADWTQAQSKSSSTDQTSALSILINALALGQETSPTSPSQSDSADDGKKNHVGAIVGGVIGSLGLIALTLLFLLYFRSWRRHHSRSLRHPSAIFIPPPTLLPNLTQPPSWNDLESSNNTSSPVTTSQNPTSYFSVSEKQSQLTDLPNPNAETPSGPQVNIDHHNVLSRIEVPTDELVRILAQRLQETQHGDSPPAYNAS
ncbi:hypothetical protein VKT23_004967 [Stygiomarasmius scandens]|uniref:Glycoside hydrolase family 76 protein n=1 Tax=Marasmiellus scandens TaxID=2682957 RepID=A0ABR1JTA2_9AGAR